MYPINSIYPNPITRFNPVSYRPTIHPNTFIHPNAAIIGNVYISANTHIAPFASIRGDEGNPIYLGQGCNIQDGVVIHGLDSSHGNTVDINGQKFSVHIGDHTSLAHQALVHGPAKVGNNVFIGMQSLIFRSTVGDNCIIEPGAKVIGVNVPAGRYVPAGEIIKDQYQADKLPTITQTYADKNLNNDIINVNNQLIDGYKQLFYSHPSMHHQ